MATVFWDACGVIFIDYLRKGKTITGEYYASLLDQLNEKLKENRPHMARKKWKKGLFQQGNAPAHKSAIAIAKLIELRFEIYLHAPFSCDLASSDFFLFPNLKNWLGGKRFLFNEEVIEETNACFEAFDSTYYSDGIKKLEYRWSIELKGDYIEK